MSKNYTIQQQLKLILAFFIILNTLSVKSQNLVPNPSFETFTACPTSLALLFLATSWTNPSTATPDYINSCSSNNFVGAPSSSFGWQNPRTGNGMTQIICSNYISSVGFTNYREYIQAQLISPLIAGQNYQVQFYVNSRNDAKINTNGIGAYISISAPISTTTNNLNFTPQIFSSVVISDTANWVLVSGNYLATGGEQYITIGNFLDNVSTINTFNTWGTRNRAIYCIDDVSVTPMLPPTSQCDTNCGPNLAPNPGFEAATLNCADSVSEMFTNYSQVQNWYGIACDTCAGNGSTPDYNNSLCNGPSATNACDGSNGSIGFFTYAIAGANAREYVQAQLTTPLVAGMEYCVSIDVKTSTGSFAYKPSDGFGLWFTNQMVDIDVQNGGQQFLGPGSLVNATPQVANAANNFIDTVCQTITGTFIATGTEQWVVLGNFRDDANTNFNTACSFFNPCFGYLVVDNLSIRTSCNNVPQPPTLTLALSNDTICNGTCSSVSASITGGTAPFTVTWDNSVPNGVGPHNICPTTTTTYTAIVIDSAGLADTTSITLYVNPLSTGTNNQTICNGDSLFIGGNWQLSSGNYTDTLTNSFGCDSILTTTLTVLAQITDSANATICQGDSLLVGGGWQTTSGAYTDTLISYTNCDSLYTTILLVNPISSFVNTLSICTGDSLFVGGAWQTSSGTFNDTLTNYLGCDSLITTNLTVTNAIINPVSATICQGDSILLGGVYQTTTGIYNDTIIGGSASGCDSVIQTTLTVNVVNIANPITSICSGDSLFIGGNWQTTSGVYTDSLTSYLGCDSIINTNLSVIPPPIANITGTDTICQGTPLVLTASGGGTYLWNTNETTSAININPITSSSYSVIVSIGTCADTANFTVVVNPIPTINAGNDVSINLGTNTTLTATGTNGTYTWSPPDWLSCVICPTTTSTPDETITYTVTVVDSNGCSATDSVTVIVAYDNVIFVPNIFSPNGDGNNDILYVRGQGIASFQFVLYDRWGEKIFETTTLDKGWNGVFRGKTMNKAVFVYYLKGFFKDGSDFNQKGDVTLIR